MSTTEVRVGDIGTHYRAKIQSLGAPFDPSNAVTKKFFFRTPGGVLERDAYITTDEIDWYLNYVVTAGIDDNFHSKPGKYSWQGVITFADGQHFSTNIETYLVIKNIV
jgi:hypothetical protein